MRKCRRSHLGPLLHESMAFNDEGIKAAAHVWPADAHTAAVVACAVLEGSPVTALTADSMGRLMHHNITAYLSILGDARPPPLKS